MTGTAERIVLLKQTIELIETAIEVENGARKTMRDIMDLVHNHHERLGNDDFYFKRQEIIGPIGKRISMSLDKKQIYLDMIAAIQKEIARLESKGVYSGAVDVAAKMREQKKKFEQLKQSMRNQAWWTSKKPSDMHRKKRIVELCLKIDEAFRERGKLSDNLLTQLRNEIDE